MASRKNVIIRLTKYYVYPQSMLDLERPLSNAKEMMDNDLVSDIEESFNGDKATFRQRFFDMEVMEELPFRIRNVVHNDRNGRFNVTLESLVNKLTVTRFEKEFGPADDQKNPNIFELVKEQRDYRGRLIRPQGNYMKPEFEAKWNEYYLYYLTTLRGVEII